MASTYNVKTARELAGMSQKELADALNIAQQSVYYYESGARDIKASMLLKMSDVLGVTVSYLLGTTDEPHEEAPADPDSAPDETAVVRNMRRMAPEGRAALLATSDALAAQFPLQPAENCGGGCSMPKEAETK